VATRSGFRDATSLTRWVMWVLYAQMFLAITGLYFGHLEHQMLVGLQEGSFATQDLALASATVSDQRQRLHAFVELVVLITGGILILRWIHRANHNARQLGARRMAFTPGWSIGYYFIPFLMLWKPYQAMKEIWQASRNPAEWERQPVPIVLPVWWTVLLVGGLLANVEFRLSLRAETLQELINANLVARIATVLDLLLAVAFLIIVRNVQHMQSQHPVTSDTLPKQGDTVTA
jgi:hypothetical protein